MYIFQLQAGTFLVETCLYAHTQILRKVREMQHMRMSGETCCFNKLEMKT